jgi:hypothetical protein
MMYPYPLSNGAAARLAADTAPAGQRAEPPPALALARRELARVRALCDALEAALGGDVGERQALAVSIEASRAAKVLYDTGRFVNLVDPSGSPAR